MPTFRGKFEKNTSMAIGGEASKYVLVGTNGVTVELDTDYLANFNPGDYLNHTVDVEGDYYETGVENKRQVFGVRRITRISW